MNDSYVLQWFGFFATIVGMAALLVYGLLAPLRIRAKDRARLYDLVQSAHERNEPLSPDVVRQLAVAPSSNRERDIRRGAILLATALGLALPLIVAASRGLDENNGTDMFLLMVAGMAISVLACLGVTFLVLGLMQRRAGQG